MILNELEKKTKKFNLKYLKTLAWWANWPPPFQQQLFLHFFVDLRNMFFLILNSKFLHIFNQIFVKSMVKPTIFGLNLILIKLLNVSIQYGWSVNISIILMYNYVYMLSSSLRHFKGVHSPKLMIPKIGKLTGLWWNISDKVQKRQPAAIY